MKDYNVNQRLIYMEERIDRRFIAIESTLAEHHGKIDFFLRQDQSALIEQVFFNGQFFEARALLEILIKSAQKRVVIIDAYIDASTFDILDVRQQGVSADIYSGSLRSTLCNAHNATGVAPINEYVWTTPSHDRWLIIDDNLFHCGHSIKDMGKKLTAIMLMGTPPETILNVVR